MPAWACVIRVSEARAPAVVPATLAFSRMATRTASRSDSASSRRDADSKNEVTCHLGRPIASLMVEALMEVTIQHLGDVRFEASARGHHAICDQPAGNGGSDAGMTPPEYLLVSLGTCAGFY